MKSTRLHLLVVATLLTFCSRPADKHQDSSTATPPVPLPASVAPPAQLQAAANNSSPEKWALLVGINNYKYPDRVSQLAGSVNDVEDMKALLVGKFEFQPEHVLMLKDTQATHAGIVAAIQDHLIAKAKKDDIVVFHYSG